MGAGRDRRGRGGQARVDAPFVRSGLGSQESCGAQGTHHDSGGRRPRLRERGLAPSAGSLRESPSDPEHSRREEPLRRRGSLRGAGEHRGSLRGNRACDRPRRRGIAQGDHRGRFDAHRQVRIRVRAPPRPPSNQRDPQGEHHEALRRTLPGLLPQSRARITRRSSTTRSSSTTCACSWSWIPRATTFSSRRISTETFSPICARGSSGGLGFAPGANVGDEAAVFETVHGSAPDIAGKGIANPVASMLSGVMLLRHLGETDAADRLRAAIMSHLARGDLLTPDMGGSATTAQVRDSVRRALRSFPVGTSARRPVSANRGR